MKDAADDTSRQNMYYYNDVILTDDVGADVPLRGRGGEPGRAAAAGSHS